MREEEKKRTSQNSSMQRFFRKRWVFPAIYLVCAALILTAVLWFQSNNGVKEDDLNGKDTPGQASNNTDEPSVPVNQAGEKFQLPVVDENGVEIFREFYDVNASAEKQEAALVVYGTSYVPNKGVDIVSKDGKEFDVVASLAGTVVRAEKDSLHGYVVEVKHSEGVSTMYQSLSELKVKEGDTVDQGDVLGTAGKNLFDSEAGIHVHFEIRNEGTAINPLDLIGEPLTAVEEKAPAEGDDKSEEPKQPGKQQDPGAEEEPSDDTPSDDDESSDGEDSDDDEVEDDTNTNDASIGNAKA